MTRNLLLTLHIAAVAGWLGADLLQYVIAPRLQAAGHDVALSWARVVYMLHDRYYAIVVVFIVLSGVALVFEGDWGWSSRFVWVGLATVVAGGIGGGVGLKGMAKKRIEALEAGDAGAAMATARRARPLEVALSALVVITILAMVAKWGAR